MFAESAWLICSILLMEWIWQYGGNVVPRQISDIPFHSVGVSNKVLFIYFHLSPLEFLKLMYWRLSILHVFESCEPFILFFHCMF